MLTHETRPLEAHQHLSHMRSAQKKVSKKLSSAEHKAT